MAWECPACKERSGNRTLFNGTWSVCAQCAIICRIDGPVVKELTPEELMEVELYDPASYKELERQSQLVKAIVLTRAAVH